MTPLRLRLIPVLVLAVFGLTPVSASASSYVQVRRFENPVPNTPGNIIAFYGTAVAALGTTGVLVGAPNEDTGGEDAGAVYLFDVATGALLRTFLPPVSAGASRFGEAIAVVGGNVLIGAPRATDTAFESGAAYLFDPTTGALLLTLHNPAPAMGFSTIDEFGHAVAAYGTDFLVGAYFEDAAAPNGGAVYRFDGTTGTLVQTYSSPSPHTNESFGSTVAAVGTTVVVGAPESIGDDGGVVYGLDGATGALLFTLSPPAGALINLFGGRLAVDGTRILAADLSAGSTGPPNVLGAAGLYDATSGALLQPFFNPTQRYYGSNDFGSGLALIGNDVFIADDQDGPGYVSQGSVFRFDATTGALLETITQGTTNTFGSAVAAMGASLVIAAPGETDATTGLLRGAVYVYAPCGNDIQELGEACEDGNLVDGDGCDSNCTPTACGNGIVTTGEACDDGDPLGADCCSALCTQLPSGTPCDDGNASTSGDQCDAGVCAGTPAIPTLSEWGILLLSLALLTRILLRSRRTARVSTRR